MQATFRSLMLLGLTLASGSATLARADDLQALEAENARLRARVTELEQENEKLRGSAHAAESALPTRVVEREGETGETVWTTEPGRIDTAGRSAHWLWLERAPGQAGATLWIRGEFSGGIYRDTDHLDLRLDGTDQSLPIAGYNATRITAGAGHRPQRRDHETLHVTLSPPLLAALAQTATLSGKLGRTSFTVPAEVLASLRALARKSV